MNLNNRNGVIIAAVVAVVAILFAIIQSVNLNTTSTQFSAAANTATGQAIAMADQGTAAVATLSAASTSAADAQQKAVTDAVNTAATGQANAVTAAANAAATAQAAALNDAVNAAGTMQAQALASTSRAAATAQAKALNDAANAAATEQAQSIATVKAQATATLGAALADAATAQASAVANASNVGATAQAAAVSTAQAQATATLSALIMREATSRADMQAQYQITAVAAGTQIAAVNNQLMTAQAQATAAAEIPTATLVPQATDVIPTAETTAESTQQVSGIPANWKRYIGKGVAIQLPNTYVGNELGTDPKTLSNLLRSLGPDFAAAAQLFESNPDILALIAVNLATGDDNFASNVIILSIPVPTNVPLEALLNATISQLPKASTVKEKNIVKLNGRDAGRMIIETNVGGIDSIQLQYYIIENKTFYLLGFTGSPGHFDAQLPLFEQSAKTFEILASPGA